jgi:hypothetical protein
MKKQLHRAIASFSFLLMLAAVSISAQAQTTERARIPFDFSVGSKRLPAGDYVIKHASTSSSVLMVQNQNGHPASIILTVPSLQNSSPSERGRLVFNRYGDIYFLAQVWFSSKATGNQVPMSHQERALSRELAKSNTKPEQVSFLMHQK